MRERVHRKGESCVCRKVCLSPQRVETERESRPLQELCYRAGDEAGEFKAVDRKESKDAVLIPRSAWPEGSLIESLWVLAADTRKLHLCLSGYRSFRSRRNP